MEEAMLASIDAGSAADNLGLLARCNRTVASAGRLGSLVVLSLRGSGHSNAPVLLQLPDAPSELLLENETLDELFKVLRRLQLGKDLVSLNKLSLFFWSPSFVGQDLSC
jgi:hypothetical protein